MDDHQSITLHKFLTTRFESDATPGAIVIKLLKEMETLLLQCENLLSVLIDPFDINTHFKNEVIKTPLIISKAFKYSNKVVLKSTLDINYIQSFLSDNMQIDHPVEESITQSCPICNKTIYKNTAVHLEECWIIASYGSIGDGRTCPICKQKFERDYLVSVHLKSCGSSDDSYVCSICSKRYKSRYYFGSHLLNCKVKKSTICTKCSKSYTDDNELKDHPCFFNSEKESFSCYLCDYTSKYEPQMSKHHTSVHLNHRDYCCETCGKLYADPSVLATHRKTHFAPDHTCTVCNKSFHRKSALNRHMTMHYSLNVPCDVCGKCFSNRMYLNRHKASQHPLNGVLTTHSCPHCHSTYREKKFLNKHIKEKHLVVLSNN